MTYRPIGSRTLFNQYIESLPDGSGIDTGWIDTRNISKVTFYGVGQSGMQYQGFFRDNENDVNVLSFPLLTSVARPEQFTTTDPSNEARYFWVNNTGITISGVSLTIKGEVGATEGAQTLALTETIRGSQQALLTQTVQRGQQPDGDFVAAPADGVVFSSADNLDAFEEYTSPWFDTDGWNCIELFVSADVPSSGQGIIVEYTNDVQAVGSPVISATRFYELNQVAVNKGRAVFNIPPRLDGARIRYVNNSFTQNEFLIEATLKTNRDTQSFDDGGALIVSNFFTEVVLNEVPNYSLDVKFGRNGEIDTGSTPEDIWANGGTYPGFNPSPTGGEQIEVFSDSAQDAGTVLVQSVADDGNRTTLQDTDLNFISSGVSVGDLLINDSRGSHGFITAVAGNQLTVFNMEGAQNGAGVGYRVVQASNNGAGVIKLKKMLKNEFMGEFSEYIVMNGTTPVDTIGTDYIRCSRAQVINAGNNGSNVGEITIRQNVTTANVFATIEDDDGQTLISCMTVPMGQTWLMKRLRIAITRNNGSAGSATMLLQTREFGGAWVTKRAFEIQTGASVDITELGGMLYRGGTDIRIRCPFVSDSNTIVDASMEYLIIDSDAF